MNENEIEFLKQELKKSTVLWNNVDGEKFFVKMVVDSYKESWEEIATPVAFLTNGGYVDLTNTSLDCFYSTKSLSAEKRI